jgi:hypothetical protein
LSLWGTNRFWAPSYDLTLFLDFILLLLPNMSLNKLRLSANFMILGATDQKLWVFEVFRRTMGRAGMCWSQWGGVDQSAQKWGKKEEKRGRQEGKKKGKENKMRPACGRRATTGRQPATGLSYCHVTVFKKIDLFLVFFWILRYFLAFQENGCIVHPFFQASPYTWKCQIFHSS